MTDDSKGPELDLDAIEARWAAAIPGPWKVSDSHGLCVVSKEGMVVDLEPLSTPDLWRGRREDAEAIAAAPDDVAALVKALRAARDERDAARAWRQEAESHFPVPSFTSRPEERRWLAQTGIAAARAEADSWKAKYERAQADLADATTLGGTLTEHEASLGQRAALLARVRELEQEVEIGKGTTAWYDRIAAAVAERDEARTERQIAESRLARLKVREAESAQLRYAACHVISHLNAGNVEAARVAACDLTMVGVGAPVTVDGWSADELAAKLAASEQRVAELEGECIEHVRMFHESGPDLLAALNRAAAAEAAAGQMRVVLRSVYTWVSQTRPMCGESCKAVIPGILHTAVGAVISHGAGRDWVSPEAHAEALREAEVREKAIADVRVDRATAELRSQLDAVQSDRRAAVSLCTLQAPRLRSQKERLEQAMKLLVRAKMAAAAVIVPAQRRDDDVDTARALIADILDYQRGALGDA